jgi:hypothetical protein
MKNVVACETVDWKGIFATGAASGAAVARPSARSSYETVMRDRASTSLLCTSSKRSPIGQVRDDPADVDELRRRRGVDHDGRLHQEPLSRSKARDATLLVHNGCEVEV